MNVINAVAMWARLVSLERMSCYIYCILNYIISVKCLNMCLQTEFFYNYFKFRYWFSQNTLSFLAGLCTLHPLSPSLILAYLPSIRNVHSIWNIYFLHDVESRGGTRAKYKVIHCHSHFHAHPMANKINSSHSIKRLDVRFISNWCLHD